MKEDLGTNVLDETQISAKTKGPQIQVAANPAIVWRTVEVINRKDVDGIWVMDANGANPTRIYAPSLAKGEKGVIPLYSPHWSPDGSSISFVQKNGTATSLYKLKVTIVNGVPTATNVTKLYDPSLYNAVLINEGSYWSFGTANEIIFIVKSNSDNLYRIQAISGNGGIPSTIYTAPNGVTLSYTTVNPDGTLIAFSSTDGTNKYLKVIKRSDGSETNSILLNSILTNVFDKDWARTSGSTKIAFYAYPLGSTTATTYTMDITDASTLTLVRSYGRSPSWSPDDSKLVFTDITAYPTNYLKTVTLSGGSLTTLTTNFAYTMHWKK
jgi:Tol biopolymer transport system component